MNPVERPLKFFEALSFDTNFVMVAHMICHVDCHFNDFSESDTFSVELPKCEFDLGRVDCI